MTIEVKHKKVSAIADSGDTDIVQPSDWNDTHELQLATARLVGRTTAGSGAAEEISAGAGLSLSGLSISFDTTWGDSRYVQPADVGTAAYEDVTTSARDTTDGRLTKVGDFGVGRLNAVTLPIRDVDSVNNASGLWRVDGLDAGTKPWGSDGAALISVYVAGSVGSGPAQLAWGSGNLYHRGGVASPWSRVYSDLNILGSVSQSAGVPTGAVIERGSNANGEYVRFADGTMICTYTHTSNESIGTAFLGGFRATAVTTYTLPASFVNGSYRLAVLGSIEGNAFGWIENTANRTTSSFRVVPVAVTSQSAADRSFVYIAIGRWF